MVLFSQPQMPVLKQTCYISVFGIVILEVFPIPVLLLEVFSEHSFWVEIK